MNTSDYIRECLRQFTNKENYLSLNDDPTEKFSVDIRSVLQIMLDSEIIDDIFDYLNVTKPRPGRFYRLPKIHKTGTPGRQIYMQQ